MKKHLLKRLLSLVLVVVLCMSVVLPAAAAGASGSHKVTFEKVDNNAVSAKPSEREAFVEQDEPSLYSDSDVVRVSIVLSGKSTIEEVGTTEDIASNSTAIRYRSQLEQEQDARTAEISKAIGEPLDVVWNLTLAANIISANVQYGQIETIESVPGVEQVLIETRYEPAVVDTQLEANPNMSTSSAQIGSSAAWAAGYTGAGSRIAVIDTGIDTDHQSFSATGFEYALAHRAGLAGEEPEEYRESLNLLDAAKTAKVWELLNASKFGVTAEQTYVSSKIPYGVNYVDKDLDITHDNDTQGEHGSHVEGIAAANAYIPNDDGTFSNALDTVKVQGVAPDAQILSMKVFGKGGGAYDSDYMAAIEDAIILEADAVNLSLGSGNPGMSRNSTAEYQSIMESLTQCGTVVAMSAGNSGSWVENASNAGYLYADDVSMQTNGSPGSYTNSLAVASVDNDGFTGEYLTVGGNNVFYTQTTGYSNLPMTTIAGEQKYILIDGFGTEEEWAAIGEALEGKIAVCSRGEISFYQKGDYAAEAGAIATIIYNNTTGTINMDLSDYSHTQPCVSITQAEGAMMKACATAVTDESGNVLYYEGTLTVEEGIGSVSYGSEYQTMSSFSSWGVPGSLQLKPEITAPGGNIYSVNGSHKDSASGPVLGGSDQYENMSGTSMASPQVAGMAALVAQYIREEGLEAQTGLSARTLTQSLLMSTAVPMKDGSAEQKGYYSVLQQGAGLANVGAAVSAASYILMDETATVSAADGKVKAELGDDPEENGTYTVKFTVYNLTGDAQSYTLRADLFTQDVFDYYVNNAGDVGSYMDTWTASLDANVSFDCGEMLNVPANGSVTVTATLALTEDQKAELKENYPNGAYVEGYIYVTDRTSDEGAKGTAHSIPVLGFFGTWSDPSMFDVGIRAERVTGEEVRIPYLGNLNANTFAVTYADEPGTKYYFGGNPLVADETYMPERNAINSENGDQISALNFIAIRNAAASRFLAFNETQNVVMAESFPGAVSSAYYYTNGGAWRNTGYTLNTRFTPAGASEGDRLVLGLTLATEYDVDAEGDVDWASLGEGATLSVPMVVDNTAPELKDISVSVTDNTMTVTASDNQYVAAVALFNNAGTTAYAACGAVQDDIQPGETASYQLDLTGVNGNKFLVQVFDYAMNVTTYKVEMQIGEEVPLPEMIAFDLDENFWTSFTTDSKYTDIEAYAPSDLTFFAATIVDHIVFASTSEGDLYVMPEGDLTDITLVGNLGAVLTDMAYNKADGKIYGVASGYLVTVDKLTGELGVVGEIPVSTNTLACDENGVFYCNKYGTGEIYKFTLETMQGGFVDKVYDFNGDGAVNEADGQALLDYATGARTAISNEDYADFDGDGNVDSYDAYLFFQKLASGELESSGAELVCKTNLSTTQYVQTMEINPNNDLLYWNSYYVVSFLGYTFGYSYLYEIDPAAGAYTRYNDLYDEMSCLIIPEKTSGGSWTTPTDQVSGIQISDEAVSLLRGNTLQLTATVQPWTATNRDVTWSSSDESVATVNARGLVTAVNAGTCTITATSVLDSSYSAACEVTVSTLQVTLKGMLQDEEGLLQTFDWNLETDDTWTGATTFANVNVISAEKHDDGTAYAVNSSGDAVLKLNLTEGTSESVGAAPVPLNDLAYSGFSTADQDLIEGIYYYYFLPAKDPSNITTSAFGFSSYLSQYTGGSEFVGVATDGWTVYNGNDAEVVYLLDDAGYLWLLKVYAVGDSYSCGISFFATNLLEAGYEINYDSDSNPLSSLAVGEDGNLYFSGFNGDTNVIYRLSYDATAQSFDAVAVGNVGSEVWPAVLFEVMDNAASVQGAARNALASDAAVEAQSIKITAEEMLTAGSRRTGACIASAAGKAVDNSQKNAGAMSTGAMAAFNGVKNNEIAPQSSSDVGDQENYVTLTVTAKNAEGNDVASTNGVMDVTYDAEALTLDSVEINGNYTSRVTERGNVTLGYVSLAEGGIAAGDTVATLVFTVRDTSREGSNSITVKHREVGSVEIEPPYEETVGVGYEHANTVVKDAKAATCTEDGYTGDTYCLDCGILLEEGEVIPATGHTEVTRNAKAATCTEDGYTGDVYCAVCNELLEQGEAIDALGHTWGEWKTVVSETCDEEGLRMHTCTVCGHTETEGIPAAGHEWDEEYTVDQEPTCTTDGSKSIHCKKCDAVKDSEVIPATGHTEEIRDAKEATCTTEGYTGDTYCTVCGEKLETGVTIPANGHTWGEWETIVSSSCTDKGCKMRTCTVCGHTEVADVDPNGHDWEDDYTIDQEPTCTEDGSKSIHCKNCDVRKDSVAIPAIGHDYQYVNQKLPTLTEPGYSGDLVCVHCGDVKEKGHVIPATGTIIGGIGVIGGSTPSVTKPTAPMPFTDVSVSDWFYSDVEYVYENGLMNGTSDTKFSPYSTLTRAMVVTVLYRIEGEPSTRYNGTFSDVANYEWYTDAVEWAAKNEIVTGYTTGKFGPNDAVTREQLAAILYRYASYKGYDVTGSDSLSGCTDSASISDYAVPAVKWAVDGSMLLTTDGKLLPREAANRAEVAAAMASFYATYVE